MAQFARPASDLDNSGVWTVTPLWSKLDEGAPGGGDVVTSDANPVSTESFTVGCGTITDPGVNTGHVIRARWAKEVAGGANYDFACELRQGYVSEASPGTLIATLTTVALGSATLTTDTYTLSEAEAGNITDYSDLSLRVFMNKNGGGSNSAGVVDLVELETPDASGGDTNVNATTAALSIATLAANIALSVTVAASTAALSLSAQTATVTLPVNVAASTASLTLTENAATVELFTGIRGVDFSSSASWDIPLAADIGTLDAFSAVGWFKIPDNSAGDDSAGIFYAFQGDARTLLLLSQAGELKFRHRETAATIVSCTSSVGFDDDTWHWYFVQKISDDEYYLYVDGGIEGSSTTLVNRTTASTTLRWGSGDLANNLPSGSLLGRMMLFNAAISLDTATTLAHAFNAADVLPASCQVWYDDTVDDLSGNNRDATENGTVLIDGEVPLDTVAAGTDALVLTTNAATVNAATNLQTGTDALTLTGQSATVSLGLDVQAGTAALTLTTFPASLGQDTNVSANTAALTLTEQPATVNAATNVQAGTASLTLTTQTATVNASTDVQAGTAALTLSANAATVNAATDIQASTASLTLTTHPASLGQDTNVQAGTAALSLTEQAATVNAETNVQAQAATLTLTGQTATISLGVIVQAGTAALSLAELQATIGLHRNVSASTDALTLTVYPATLNLATNVGASTATLTLTAYTATVATIEIGPPLFQSTASRALGTTSSGSDGVGFLSTASRSV